MSDSANRRPAGPPGSAARRQHARPGHRGPRRRGRRGLGARGLAVRARVHPRHRPDPPHLDRPAPARPAAGLRRRAWRTPHLDRLAAGATVFTHAYGHAAASLPAHASLFTGLLPYDHGVRDDVGFTLAPARRNAGLAAGRPRLRRPALPYRPIRLRAGTGLDAGFARYDDERPRGRRRGAATGRARQCGDRDGGGGLARRAGLGALLLHAAPERHGRRRSGPGRPLGRRRTPASPPPTPPSAGCSRRCGARAGTTTRWSSSPRPPARRPTRTCRGAVRARPAGAARAAAREDAGSRRAAAGGRTAPAHRRGPDACSTWCARRARRA